MPKKLPRKVFNILGKVIFLDTNIILRYITRDNPQQGQKARNILKEVANNKLTVNTSEGVIIEIVQVLSSKVLYNLPREEIKKHLQNILSLKKLKLSNKSVFFKALDLYVTYPRMDFVDCLNVAHMKRLKINKILSFDRDFDKIEDIDRIESS